MPELAHPLFAYLSVFLAGLLSSASPCVLVTIPLVIGFVGGYAEGDVRKSFVYSLFFVLGLALTFTLLGMVAALAGRLMGDIGSYWKYLLSAVAIIMGLQMMEITRLQIPTPRLVTIGQKGIIGAFLLGMLFGVASSPCATPVLVLLLTYVASRQNILYGMSLLFVYSLAHMVLIFVVGVSTGLAEAVLQSKRFSLVSSYSRKICGLLFVLFGLLLFFYW